MISTLGIDSDVRTFSESEVAIQKAYIAYYGRAADAAGLAYWSERLEDEGGIDSVIQAFGTSAEFNERFGSLSDSELINNLYQQLFGRDADPEGLDYYTGQLASGGMTLQSIALGIINGVRNADVDIVDNKLAVSNYLTYQLERFDDLAPDISADELAEIIGSVDVTQASMDTAIAELDAYFPDDLPEFVHRFEVTKTEDTADGETTVDCSLREAIMAANASDGPDLIVVPDGVYTLTLNGDDGSTDRFRDLVLTDDVYIQGASRDGVIIDGGNQFRLFQIDPFSGGIDVTLANMTLQHGNESFGGAIINNADTVLTNVSILDNTANNGGGILNSGDLTLNGVMLEGNEALPANDVTGFGGGIWNNENATLTINDSSLTDNQAHFNGAGIYNVGILDISTSDFAGNLAGNIGGAIDNIGTLSIQSSTFSTNQANDGGGISNQTGGSLLIIASSFTANDATGVDLGGGGALFNYQGTVTIRESAFLQNTALGEGGGAMETHGDLSIYDSTVSENIAYWHDQSQLPSDTASGFGGGLLVIAGSNVVIDNTDFQGNIAGTSGGAIYNDRQTQLSVVEVLIDGNTAERNYGGGVYNEGNIDFMSTTISNNSSREHGSGIGTGVGEVTFTDSVVTDNLSAHGGGLANFNGGTVRLFGTLVTNNMADSSQAAGGGVLNDIGTYYITDSVISGNSAYFGGGVSNNSQSGTVVLDGTTIEDNMVSHDGSAIVNFGHVAATDSILSGTISDHGTFDDISGNLFLF